ncbi:MAG TPA: DUF4276 family protein [Thermoanaerobaculia bacterium]|nr:DUF4276 family protein [Thermoanaerobaculia bacterium]
MIIQPIVEGQGEEAAVPLLLRRLRDEAQAWGLEVGRPHRRRRTQLVKKDSLQTAVRVAALREECAAILVLFDADDDCPKELAPALAEWAAEAAPGKACAVVMANREYEAWFLASIEALRGKNGIVPGAVSHPHPEVPRDAKGHLQRWIQPGASYSASVDRAALTAHLDLEIVYRRCRSFRKLVRAFGSLAAAVGVAPEVWPPAAWVSLIEARCFNGWARLVGSQE